ncbi:uncharacterized protein LAESUDRAFT_755378 [Laetiporus sulphureus 93-53]|uniref:Ribonuclease H1 N-terminal domain-containing protein n=1 Tax=Laetiporus sulphureus 93-53 TaxID=1314785 RepID=A0A165GR35_9APHY|nr:uncharacterized protein LAESUDRAFT_755378 [Laetiporus sulphureus 93-53]KZT10689.1 hypothetical protein LAESUDRAFT_755378 [Laetiporus sulphureus 93-53]
MGRTKVAYVVFRGTRPGVYSTWEECNFYTSEIPGNCYKGYATRAEAARQWANALAGGRIKTLQRPTDSPVPPSPLHMNSPPSPRARRSSRQHSPREIRVQLATASAARPASASGSDTRRAATQARQRTPSPLLITGDRATPQSAARSSASSPDRSGYVSSGVSQYGTPATSPVPTPPSSPDTGVSVILPDEPPSPYQGSSDVSSPADSTVRSLEVTRFQVQSPVGKSETTANDSPATEITQIEPFFSSLSIGGSAADTPAPRPSPIHRPSTTSSRSGSAGSTPRQRGSRTLKKEYSSSSVQTEPETRMFSSKSSARTTPAGSSSATRALARSQSERQSASPASRAPVVASPSSPSTIVRSYSEETYDAPGNTVQASGSGSRRGQRSAEVTPSLSPLGLALSQPMHASNMVIDAASDPRSPISRRTAVPAR